MATASFNFNLLDPDDRKEHFRMTKSMDMASALWQITHNTRKSIQYSIENKEMDKFEAVDYVFERIYEILQERNIDLSELID
jgi:hypothetical protein